MKNDKEGNWWKMIRKESDEEWYWRKEIKNDKEGNWWKMIRKEIDEKW